MNIRRIDHLVLTVNSIAETVAFYTRVLGMQRVDFSDQRVALQFAEQKINLHERGREFLPNAACATVGSADLCLISDVPLVEAMKHVIECAVDIIEGPVPRTGACGAMMSFYIRDPDGNLIEISEYEQGEESEH